MSAGHEFVAPGIGELQPHFTQYAIEEFVAVGGMGAVYRARQVSVDRPVALKVLPPQLAGDADFRRRFAMEARAMAKLSHRNLVQLYDFGEDEAVVWMTQEWVEGRTVFALLHEEGAMDPAEAAAMVAQACEGLGYAHKQGIVHRDVKPGNIMEDADGILKLMDFGLARAMQGGPAALQSQGAARYATPEYAAPELWEAGPEVDHRVDIFALGVLLFEALTGERPGAEFRMPSAVRAGLDPRYDGIVVRALQRKPENRFGSCSELLAVLRAVVTTPQAKPASGPLLVTGKPPGTAPVAAAPVPTTEVVPASGTGTTEGGKGGGMWLALSAVSVVAILAGVGWLLFSGDGKKDADPVVRSALVTPTAREVAEERAARLARNQRERGAATEQERKRQARAKEQKEREAARQAAMRGEQGQNPDGVGTADPAGRRLEEIDAQLRTLAAEPFGKYQAALARWKEQGLAACERGEAAAAKAGDLDGVLFWIEERDGIERGAPWDGGADLPKEALALRREWREHLTPLADELKKLQSTYLESCGEVERGGLTAGERVVLESRREAASHFDGFLELCAGRDPGPPKGGVAARPLVPEVPLAGKFLEAYGKLQSKLNQMQPKGERKAMESMIKSFGRHLVAEEKRLTMAREIPQAVAVRRLKDDLVKRLELLAAGGQPGPAGGGSDVALLRDGKLTEHGVLSDRSHWRRKEDSLVNTGGGSWLRSVKALGPGDFSIRLRFMMDRIGATEAMLILGETGILLDNPEGLIQATGGGAIQPPVTGQPLTTLARSGGGIDCVVERKAGLLRVSINDQEGLRAPIHDREIGVVRLASRKATMRVVSLEIEGTLIDPLKSDRLAWKDHPRGRHGRVQLVGTGKNSLLCLVGSWSGDQSTLSARHSRGGGGDWDERKMVLTQEDFGNQPLSSFVAAPDPDEGGVWLLYTTGKVNQKVFVTRSRNRGRSWLRGDEITGVVKEPGWNVNAGARGLVLQRNRKRPGRIVLPILARPQGADAAVFVLVSKDGRDWSRIGPLVEQARHGVELMEDEEGQLWLATGSTTDGQGGYHRRWVTSEDGGDTWSKPVLSMLPDTSHRSGDLVMTVDGRGKPVWFYATVDGPVGNTLPRQTNLTLFGSRDRGENWTPLRRFHYGKAENPSLVPLGPGRCGVAFLQLPKHWRPEEVHYLLLDQLRDP